MSWQQAAGWFVAGAVGTMAALVGVAWGTAYVLAESEARESKELEEYRREEARRAARNPGNRTGPDIGIGWH